MKKILFSITSFFALSLALLTSSAEAANCYKDVCVGDAAVNILRNYRQVTVVGIDNYGKFVLRFEDNGTIGGNWDRADLALLRGCVADVCVGFPALNVSRNYRSVKVFAIQADNRMVLRFDDNGGVGGNWSRSDLAVAWGCVGNLCVNDTVYNRTNARQAVIAAIQTNTSGAQDRMVLNYGPSGLGGNWEVNDLVLIQRGPPAYPPNYPPVPPQCPPGTHWDPVLARCVANVPPPPPLSWSCTIRKPGRMFTGRGRSMTDAIHAVLTACGQANGGYVCRASEAVCRSH